MKKKFLLLLSAGLVGTFAEAQDVPCQAELDALDAELASNASLSESDRAFFQERRDQALVLCESDQAELGVTLLEEALILLQSATNG